MKASHRRAPTATAVAPIRLGLQALRENVPGDTADHEDQAAVLHALYDDRNRSAGVLGMISDLLTGIGVRIEDQGGEGITEVIDEAAAYVQDSAGRRPEWARTVLPAPEASYGSPRGPPAPSATAGPTAPTWPACGPATALRTARWLRRDG
ncbi:hypothetical protein [Streptomyces virginiae]|uniref:hypothetical protein n=1 Tax=Streptomyces virginiae TaxID=1961 RepID=UPI002DDA3607|nr:hypothetical protein [Streptomyces virginiae]WSC74844.1 hypothetical protein OHA56_00050 [Streptomyces virginiae]WSC82153.1 hypothetical protein OHA56_40745 [Streptomyces virginiae]